MNRRLSKRSYKLWSNIEKRIGNKFPEEIKAILDITGFDIELSLKGINEKTVESIEQIVNENIVANNTETVAALKGSTYEGKPLPFRFLLGHKILILSLPDKIASIKKKSGKSKNSHEQNTSDELQVRDPEDHKKILLVKLKTYAKNHNLNFEIKESNITKLNQINRVTKCVVECCFCKRKIPCQFDTHWQISNLTNHIRTHLKNSHHNQSQNPVTIDSDTSTSLQIQRAPQGVLAEITNIL